jgi:hypothetical protein
MLRMRHAYGKVEFLGDDGKPGSMWLLLGQVSVLISPLYPDINHDMVMWYAGNLGDRRAQVQLGWKLDAGEGATINPVVSFGLNDAILGSSGGTGTASLAGELAGSPNLQFRVAYKLDSKNADGKVVDRTEFGLWIYQGRFEVTPASAVAGNTKFDANCFGIDVHVAIDPKKMWLELEFYSGEGLGDIRGTAGNVINSSGDSVAGTGLWVNFHMMLTDDLRLMVGFNSEDTDEDDIAVGGTNGVDLTTVSYFLLQHKAKGSNWSKSLEFQAWKTEYVGGGEGDNTRIKMWFSFGF